MCVRRHLRSADVGNLTTPRTKTMGYRRYRPCTKFLDCWPISVEQFAAVAKTTSLTIRQIASQLKTPCIYAVYYRAKRGCTNFKLA